MPKPELMGPAESENALERALRVGDSSSDISDLSAYYSLLINKTNKTSLDRKLLNWFESG